MELASKYEPQVVESKWYQYWLDNKLFSSTPDVLYRVVQHVAHVKHTRYVWWRNNHSVRLAAIRRRTEKLVVQPILVPF